VRGGTALLHRWFALVREKRGPKLEFLKALVRAFDVGTSLVAAQEDVDFARYMAENFAAFDYKTQEEVLLVVRSLTNVLSTAGMQCVEALSPRHLLAQLQAPTNPQPPPTTTITVTQVDSGEGCMLDATITGEQTEQSKTRLVICLRCSALLTSNHSDDDNDGMADARKTPVIANFHPDHHDYAPQNPSEEPLWAHGRVRITSSSRFPACMTCGYRKCLKWVIGKKNALGDRPATRRTGAAAAPLTWARLPFATQPLVTTAHMAAQRDTVWRTLFTNGGLYSHIKHSSSWRFGTKMGSQPSQKMTFHENASNT